MEPVIYFRGSLAEEAELLAAEQHFRVILKRTEARPGDLVIPRYSALPWNQELCEDLAALGATPINTYREHRYAADLRNWYEDLEGLTPKTWFALDQIPKIGGPFVLKGATNSRKHWWSTQMYAENYLAATEVYMRLGQDSTVGDQDIYIREYVPLQRLATGLHDLPISREFRFFVLDKQVVASGFYWSSYSEDLSPSCVLDSQAVPQEFIHKVIDLIGDQIRFYVVDFAETATGDWIVIEVNDGQQSGLSDIDPQVFYRELRRVIDSRVAALPTT